MRLEGIEDKLLGSSNGSRENQNEKGQSDGSIELTSAQNGQRC